MQFYDGRKKKVVYAVLLGPVITAFIKLFGAAFGLMGILYTFRFRYIMWGVIITILLTLLPLPITGVSGLIFQYKSYLALLGADHAASLGLSVMGWLTSWFNLSISKIGVLGVGVILLLLPLIKVKNYDQAHFRLLFMTYIMIWMVIFNHRAESPTYIIAVVAALIAILATEIMQWFHYLIIIILMVFTSLIMSDLFPNSWKDTFFIPYVIKAVPCIGIWIWNGYMLLYYRKEH